MIELGMRNEELGIPNHPPSQFGNSAPGGWAAFLIPNSYFLIGFRALPLGPVQ